MTPSRLTSFNLHLNAVLAFHLSYSSQALCSVNVLRQKFCTRTCATCRLSSLISSCLHNCQCISSFGVGVSAWGTRFVVAGRTLTTLHYQLLSGVTTEINPSTVISSLEKGSNPFWQISRVTTDRTISTPPTPRRSNLLHTASGFDPYWTPQQFYWVRACKSQWTFQCMEGQ